MQLIFSDGDGFDAVAIANAKSIQLLISTRLRPVGIETFEDRARWSLPHAAVAAHRVGNRKGVPVARQRRTILYTMTFAGLPFDEVIIRAVWRGDQLLAPRTTHCRMLSISPNTDEARRSFDVWVRERCNPLQEAWRQFIAEHSCGLAITLNYNPRGGSTTSAVVRVAADETREEIPRSASGANQVGGGYISAATVQADLGLLHRDVDRRLYGARFHKPGRQRSKYIGVIEHEASNIHVHLAWRAPGRDDAQVRDVIGGFWEAAHRHGSVWCVPIKDDGWGDYISKQAKMKAMAPADPRGPQAHLLQHVVTLPPADTQQEQWDRWQRPQRWCRDNVLFEWGDRWSCHFERGSFVFSFSNPDTAVFFELRFR